MATNLTFALNKILSWTMTNALDLSTPVDSGTLNWKDDLTDGTGTDEADAIWHDERTVTAAAETLDLTALTGGPWASTVSFASIKGIFIYNTSTTTTEDLTVGAAGAAPWFGWVGGATHTRIVKPNGQEGWWSPTDASAVGAAKNLKIDPGAATITYRILIIGIST